MFKLKTKNSIQWSHFIAHLFYRVYAQLEALRDQSCCDAIVQDAVQEITAFLFSFHSTVRSTQCIIVSPTSEVQRCMTWK